MMASNQFVRNLMGEQRRRAIGALMQHIEREVNPHLTERQRRDLRARVLGSITQYHDTCLDVLKASVADGGMVNEDALTTLTRIEGKLSGLEDSRG